MRFHFGVVHHNVRAGVSGAGSHRIRRATAMITRYARSSCGQAQQIATAIHAVKADQVRLRLQKEFYEKAKHPLETRQ